jgi:excisionase family DNA binding protein
VKPPRRPAQAEHAADEPRPLVYTAQDVARFCEVDLKTIHNWAVGGKIPHHRTAGRHLRFRHAHVVAFLRRHGYPIHAELASARPIVFFAAAASEALDDAPLKESARRLASRFHVRRFATALEGIAHLVAGQPDALIVSAADPTWSGVPAVGALRASVETASATLVVITDDARGALADAMRSAGVEIVIAGADLARLGAELARTLGVDRAG